MPALRPSRPHRSSRPSKLLRASRTSAFAGLLLSACGAPASGGDADAEESGPACTEIGCSSSLVVSVTHDFDFGGGGYLIELETPAFELRCSVPAEASGTDSCFGFRFADISWDANTLNFEMTEPFFDAEVNPEATPFESVDLRIFESGELRFEGTLMVDGGEPLAPNGPDCPPVCWQATASVDLTTGS